jgi:hypothetical protein
MPHTYRPKRKRPSSTPSLPPQDCIHLGPVLGYDQPGCCGAVAIHACSVHQQTTKHACIGCPDRDKRPPITLHTELLNEPVPVTIGIPTRGSLDLLPYIIALHRLQVSIVPRFLIVDTGSTGDDRERLREIANAPDIELIELGVVDRPHKSEPVCIAMQVIYDMCQTRLLLQTHSDCVPASRFAVTDLAHRWQRGVDVIGYQMSARRRHPIWDHRRMVSHTFTLFDRESINAAVKNTTAGNETRSVCDGYVTLNHCMRAACAAAGGDCLQEYHDGNRVNWPDTECGFNWPLQQIRARIELLGHEQNHTLDRVPHYWHVRSLPSAALYASGYHRRALDWQRETREQAESWLREWARG